MPTTATQTAQTQVQTEIPAADPETINELAIKSIPLTPYQHRILQLRLSGLSIREIEKIEGTTRQTIGFHITRAYRKLGISHFVQLPSAYAKYRREKNLPKLPQSFD